MTDANGHGGSAPTPSIDDLKQAARAAALRVRASPGPAAGAALATIVLESGLIAPGSRVAGYWPMGSEMDVRPLMVLLCRAGHTLMLPRTPRRGLPLSLHAWAPGHALEAGRFGTLQPLPSPALRPDVVLVPLLAFDARCRRLGYGGGYYDRTLAALPNAVAIGCAFAAQQVPEVPCGPYDVALSAVATQSGMVVA